MGNVVDRLKVIVFIALVITISCSGTPLLAAATSPERTIVILTESNRAISKTLGKHLATNLQLLSNQFQVEVIEDFAGKLESTDSLVVTVGQVPLQRLLASGYQGAYLATLITPLEYQTLMSAAPNAKGAAIYHQAPILRQMLLFKELYPKGRRVGILISPEEQGKIDTLQALALKVNLILEYEVVAEPESLSKSLLKLINRTDAIIATNDNKIYNRSTIKSILLTLYRHNKFLLGADKNFIKPGSVATTYTTMQQLLDEVVDAINFYFSHNSQLPSTHFSKRFSVSFNNDVARSLNLVVRKESHYTDIIQATEINFGGVDVYE
ncbi:MAG: hypothetical protein HWE13_06740 [Gammaproteobacteria bacterium]|nr:hypothetical protein [Gammaproteobacteria bacterium]